MRLQEEKKEVLAHIRAMRDWVMEVEHIFDGSWASQPEEISNVEVGRRLNDWLHRLAAFLQAEGRTPPFGASAQSDDAFETRIGPMLR
jgi:hypothetical protein